MPDVEVLKFPSREGASSLQDQEDRQAVCPSRRRSCALVNTPSPCVNKAVGHIQELKRKLENWWQLHLRPDGKTLNNSMLGLTSDGQDDGLPKELCIEGIGLLGDPSNGMRTLRKEAMDILMDAAYLIDRLEADRQEAKEALLKEKQTRETLKKKMDSLTLWRMQEFPVVVQNEHEACLRDICELKWHLKRKKEKLEQVKEKVTHTQVLHHRLIEDIDFVKKHKPLVKEKLEMETEIMSKIKAAQIEADDSFAKSTKNLCKFEHLLKEEEDGCHWEKKEFARELGKLQRNLMERQQEYEELKALWVGISSKVEETEEAIAEMTDVCNRLSQHIPELEQQEDLFKDKVMAMKLEIEMEGAKIDHIKTCKTELQKQIAETRQTGETKVEASEDNLCKKRKELIDLQEEAKELELEIEDYTKKINQSEQAMKQLQVDMRHIKLKIAQNEEARAKTQEELSQVMALHCSTKTKLEDLEQLIFTEEQSNRKVTEKLKKKIMVEMKAIAILKGKLSAAKVEFSEEKARSNNEMEELQGEFDKASSATAALETKVKEQRQIYINKEKQTESLKTELANIQTAKQTYSDDLQKKRNAKLQSLNAVRELHDNVSEKYENTKCRIIELRAISVEYREESDTMEKAAKYLPAIIEELQSISDGIQYKHERALTIMTSLQQDITSCEERTVSTAEAHEVHLKERRAVMQKIKADLREALQENVRLANEYRGLQKALINVKREAVFVFDEKNQAEVSFQERKQLSLLQKRMHKAMVKYFNHRSLHSQAELAYFQSLSNANNQKITTVQEELSKAIQRLSAFLHSLTDDSTTTGDDANKQSGPDANGLSGEMPAVQIAV